MSWILNIKVETNYSVIAFFFCSQIINNIFVFFITDDQTLFYIKCIIYAIPIAYMIYNSIVCNKIYIYFVPAIIYFIFILISLRVVPEIKYLLSDPIQTFLSRCIVAFYFAYIIKDYKKMFDSFKKYIGIAIIYCVLYIVFQKKVANIMNYMQFADSLLFISIVCFILGWLEKKKKYYLAFLIFCFAILLYGSRSPLICIVVAITIITCTSIFFQKIKIQTILSFLMIIILSCIMVFFDGISILITMLHLLFPTSRTIALLMNNRISYDSERNVYYRHILSIFTDNPYKFRGLFSDRVYLGKYFEHSISDSTGSYVHNIIIEIIFQWGAVIGVTLLILLGILVIKKYVYILKNKDIYGICFFGLTVSTTVTLFFSSSYLSNYYFWFLLSYLLFNYKNSKLQFYKKEKL